jgi:hypothetical protein
VTDSEPGPDRQHDAKDAHVQVLTAEVRTLVVGSRQVTMSVYGQLDEVCPGDIEPFGRVSPREACGDWVYVVGRDVSTGALVRSCLPFSNMGLAKMRYARLSLLKEWLPQAGAQDGTPVSPAPTASALAEYGVQAEQASRRVASGTVVHLLLLREAVLAFARAVKKASSSEDQEQLLERAKASQEDLDIEMDQASNWEELSLIVLR